MDAMDAPSAATPQQQGGQTSLWQDLLALLVKLLVLFAVFWLIFHYIFGVHRYLSTNMSPAIQDGDLALFYRLDHSYSAGEVAVFSYEGKTLLARVVAVAGDTVDFNENGMLINGALVQEDRIYTETTMFREGVTFPVRVGEGQIFVLGDNRPHATDSRIFGCVDIEDVEGKVIGLLRRRNL